MRNILPLIIAIAIVTSGSMLLLWPPEDIEGKLSDGSALSTRSPIVIARDSDFTSGNGVSSGTGTSDDPYIIEDWNISAVSSDGISIRNTDKYFIIRNCRVSNGYDEQVPRMNSGIKLENLAHGVITNCLLVANYRGIEGVETFEITVYNNTCELNRDGIGFYQESRSITIRNNHLNYNIAGIKLESDTDGCLVANNSISRSFGVGIGLEAGCDGNVIENNDCLDTYNENNTNDQHGEGIVLVQSSINTIRNNNCSGGSGRGISITESSDDNLVVGNVMMNIRSRGDGLNRLGILMANSINNTFRQNKLTDCGFRLYLETDGVNVTTSNIIDDTNTVNGKPIVFLQDSVGEKTITGDVGQVILVNCESVSILDMTFEDVSPAITVIDGWSIHVMDCEFRNLYEAIVIEGGQFISVEEVEIDNFYWGIQMTDGLDSGVYNCTLKNGQYGIYWLGAHYSTVEWAMITNVREGIRVGALPLSGNCLIKENMVSGGYNGIWADGENHRIFRNIVDSNTNFGIGIRDENILVWENQVLGNKFGIDIKLGTSVSIMKNVIMWNEIGIYSDQPSVEADVFKNNISHNEGYGIDLNAQDIEGCAVLLNVFMDNNNGGTQARDRGQSSKWDDGISQGNFWGDYGSRYVPPATNDGTVWDTPYVVDGGTASKDNYPLVSVPITLPQLLRISRNHQLFAPVDHNYSVDYSLLYSGSASGNITWKFSTNAGWLTFDSNHTLKGKPTTSDIGSYWVNLSATDGVLSDSTNFTIKVALQNMRPNITTADVTSVDQWQRYSVDYDAIDDDTDLEWRLVTEAGFLSINRTTGVLSGVPGLSDVGTFFVNVSVNDGKFWDISIFLLTVNDVNDPPMQNTSRPYLTMLEDTTLRIPVTQLFFNYDNDPMSFSVSDGTNINASIDNGSNLNIVPDADWFGTDELTFNVSDGHYDKIFVIDVVVQPVNDAPRDLRISFASMNLVEGGNQIVLAEYLDPDIGDRVNVTWYIDGVFVSHAFSFNLSLPEGHYNLTLRVSDSYGNYTEITVPITIERGGEGTPSPHDNDHLWLLRLFIPFLVLLVIGALFFIFRRRSRAEAPTEEFSAPSSQTISRKKPSGPSLDLDASVELRSGRVKSGHLERRVTSDIECDARDLPETPWSRRFDDELQGIMGEALEEGISIQNDDAISSLIKRLKRKQLDGELSKGDYRRLRYELVRILEE